MLEIEIEIEIEIVLRIPHPLCSSASMIEVIPQWR